MKQEFRFTKAEKKLRQIFKKADKHGISAGEIVCLPNVRKLCSDRKSSVWQIATVVVSVLAVLAYAVGMHTTEGFSKLWLGWKNQKLTDQQCTIPMPDSLVKIFRPPVHCSMCYGITEVEKVVNITPNAFEKRYAYSGRPVIVQDGTANWTARNVFTFDFFKSIYERNMKQWSTYGCQFFPYDTEFEHLRDVFNMSRERALAEHGTRPWYVGWSNCDEDVNHILRRHYQRPYFLPTTAETKRLDWIFMGSSGYGAPMHVDNVEHPSWQAQLRGRKKWSLRPPPECFYHCGDIEVVVEPGEIIVLDTNRWYHSTLIVSEEMSITLGAEYD